MTIECWYRYEDVAYSPGADEYGDPLPGSTMRVHLREFEVLKRTPKGAWLNAWRGKRFVRSEARKQYACATKEAALASFKARKQAQIRIYEARVCSARAALEIVEQGNLDKSIFVR